ncbi:unnamed protein product, partial [Iphiclides podalirius]
MGRCSFRRTFTQPPGRPRSPRSATRKPPQGLNTYGTESPNGYDTEEDSRREELTLRQHDGAASPATDKRELVIGFHICSVLITYTDLL